MSHRGAILGLLLLVGAPLAVADSFIDFEGLLDGTPITTQYFGLVFTSSTVLSAGFSLNELEFPPQSGANAAFDDGGPMSIAFLTPATFFSAYITYTVPVTLTAYDAANNIVGSVSSQFSNNFVSSGNAPDELLSLSFAGGFSQLVITGDPGGGSLVLDDVTVTDLVAMPEPSALALLCVELILPIAALFLISALRRRSGAVRISRFLAGC